MSSKKGLLTKQFFSSKRKSPLQHVALKRMIASRWLRAETHIRRWNMPAPMKRRGRSRSAGAASGRNSLSPSPAPRERKRRRSTPSLARRGTCRVPATIGRTVRRRGCRNGGRRTAASTHHCHHEHPIVAWNTQAAVRWHNLLFFFRLQKVQSF